jgi:hypothetical protein
MLVLKENILIVRFMEIIQMRRSVAVCAIVLVVEQVGMITVYVVLAVTAVVNVAIGLIGPV